MDIAELIHDQCLIHPIVDTAYTGNDLYILRDDLLPFGMGGNKVRIAIEFVADMRAKGKNAMIAYGSSTSNMCRAIANLCKAEGVPCTVVLSDAGNVGIDCNNKHLMDIFQANVITCSSDAIAPAVEQAMTQFVAQGYDPYYIFGNKWGQGNEHVATRAYSQVYPHITAYATQHGFSFDYIFVASGTQSTQSGLTCGQLMSGDSCQVCGIMISSRSDERALSVLQESAQKHLQERGFDDTGLHDAIHLICNKRRGGYGVFGQDIIDCITTQLSVNGIALDPVYTGKAFLGMQEYLQENAIAGKNILFVHTGGEPIFYDNLTKGVIQLDARNGK